MKTNSIIKYFDINNNEVYTLEEANYVEMELFGKHSNLLIKDQLSKYINTTNNNTMLISKESLPIILDYCWYLSKDSYVVGYPALSSVDRLYPSSLAVGIKLHRLIKPNVPKGYVVDHINRNRLDNRINNLRVCTYKQNSYNKTKPSNSKYKYKGVKQNKNGSWSASVSKDGKKHTINKIASELEAASIYNALCEDLFGIYAAKNL
jgi:hypothetical protein